jgi:hypothetical protein
MGLELRGEKEPIESEAKGEVGQGLKGEGSEFAFHGLECFDVEFSVAKETVFGLFNRLFLGERAEFPVNIDQKGFRQVFKRGDDTVPELTGRGELELECFHAFDSEFNRGPLG